MGRKAAEHNEISETNNTYLASYEASFEKKTSWQQYKVDCVAFLAQLGERDLVKIKVEDVEAYLNGKQDEKETTQNNRRAHIYGFLRHVISNNLGNAKFHINKNVLFALI